MTEFIRFFWRSKCVYRNDREIWKDQHNTLLEKLRLQYQKGARSDSAIIGVTKLYKIKTNFVNSNTTGSCTNCIGIINERRSISPSQTRVKIILNIIKVWWRWPAVDTVQVLKIKSFSILYSYFLCKKYRRIILRVKQ